jgi:hypothetical protein
MFLMIPYKLQDRLQSCFREIMNLAEDPFIRRKAMHATDFFRVRTLYLSYGQFRHHLDTVLVPCMLHIRDEDAELATEVHALLIILRGIAELTRARLRMRASRA